MRKDLKTLRLSYSAEVFYTVCVAVDETLDPLNNWEDREYLEKLVEHNELDWFTNEESSYISKSSIELEPERYQREPDAVITKDESEDRKVIWYRDYLKDNNEEERELTMKLLDFNEEGGEEVAHQ